MPYSCSSLPVWHVLGAVIDQNLGWISQCYKTTSFGDGGCWHGSQEYCQCIVIAGCMVESSPCSIGWDLFVFQVFNNEVVWRWPRPPDHTCRGSVWHQAIFDTWSQAHWQSWFHLTGWEFWLPESSKQQPVESAAVPVRSTWRRVQWWIPISTSRTNVQHSESIHIWAVLLSWNAVVAVLGPIPDFLPLHNFK